MSTTSSGHGRHGSSVWTQGARLLVGTLLVMVGVMQGLEAIAALAGNSIFDTGTGDVYGVGLTVWGWIHLVIAVCALLTGAGILADRSWAIVLGMVIGFFSALASFAFLPYYPLWSVVILAFDIWLLWALAQELGSAD
jgi:hypothetical protein